MTIQRSNDLSHGQGFKTKTNYGPDTAEEIILDLREPENRAQPSARKQSRQKGLFKSSLLKHRKRKRGQDMMKYTQIKHLIFSKTTNIINTCNENFYLDITVIPLEGLSVTGLFPVENILSLSCSLMLSRNKPITQSEI